ncbi:hypothetical protein HMPREF0072_0619 [Anaerococcus lactolyticus ATCC 51172]|uniref:Uncharacterized protein n=1 Tax=Anaerococcus lactolyticus ATCC 51172 TaxID=525254 RepID=C2BE49_9FIRM|nr:hypothetical protein HMPREF0072_0619 [Anaerococcus lactolyticus ATCC 51172]
MTATLRGITLDQVCARLRVRAGRRHLSVCPHGIPITPKARRFRRAGGS